MNEKTADFHHSIVAEIVMQIPMPTPAQTPEMSLIALAREVWRSGGYLKTPLNGVFRVQACGAFPQEAVLVEAIERAWYLSHDPQGRAELMAALKAHDPRAHEKARRVWAEHEASGASCDAGRLQRVLDYQARRAVGLCR